MNEVRTCTACGYTGPGWKHVGDQDGRPWGMGVFGYYNCPNPVCSTTKVFEPGGPVSEMLQVALEVEGGVATPIVVPDGVEVIVIDRDSEGEGGAEHWASMESVEGVLEDRREAFLRHVKKVGTG